MKTIDQIIEEFGGVADNWKPHPNGGGWVHRDVVASPEAFVGPEAVARGGTIRGGTIEGGTIEGGTIRGGTIRGGTIRGGTIRGGTIWGGTIEGGTIRGGTIEGGTIEGGTIEGGTIWGGTIEGGTIWGGTIEGGTWNRAPLFVTGSRHLATNAKPGHLRIGCRCEPFAWWTTPEAEVFADEAGYTAEEKAEYRAIVELFQKIGV